MKLAVLCFLLVLAIDATESQSASKVVCLKKDEVLKVLKGRYGVVGPPGLKGDRGLRGDDGSSSPGDKGPPGENGEPGRKGKKGMRGDTGAPGPPGYDGIQGLKGEKGLPGLDGERGDWGYPAPPGFDGEKGEPGSPGLPGAKINDDIAISLLNDYYIVENGYFNILYHVKSRDLTDGRTDTGGWGSKTAKTGNYIEATFVHPVYVTSFTVAGGLIPSWRDDTKQGYGFMDLEYSSDGNIWTKITKLQTPVGEKMITRNLTTPVTAQYWRLISTENKWVGTTEFALKPLVKPAVLGHSDSN